MVICSVFPVSSHAGRLDACAKRCSSRIVTDEKAQHALFACLEHLRTSSVTQAGQVAVLDAWVDGPDAFCVVYQPPYQDGEVGIRRSADDAATPTQQYRPGDLTDGYDLGDSEVPDPVAFGWNVADFDIGEPGTGPLRHDEDSGTSWWGSLGDALPMRRTAP